MNAPIPTNPQTPVSPENGNSMTRAVPRLTEMHCHEAYGHTNSPSRLIASSSGATSRKPLHQSSPTLRTTHCFPVSAGASRSNPTMSSFKGMSRIRGPCSPHQHNALFLQQQSSSCPQQSLHHPLTKTTSGKPENRCNLVALDKIVQRSSSKCVKQTLVHLEGLCQNGPHTSAPWKEVDMLLELSTDIYYRVVMKKCRGCEILTTVQESFPQLHDSCERLLKALSIPGESGPSPRSTRTTVLLDSTTMETPTIDDMQLDRDSSKRGRSDSSEDIVQIINEGCQNILWK